MSANGAIVVGTANDENSDDSAFLWDAAGGMRKLRDELVVACCGRVPDRLDREPA